MAQGERNSQNSVCRGPAARNRQRGNPAEPRGRLGRSFTQITTTSHVLGYVLTFRCAQDVDCCCEWPGCHQQAHPVPSCFFKHQCITLMPPPWRWTAVLVPSAAAITGGRIETAYRLHCSLNDVWRDRLCHWTSKSWGNACLAHLHSKHKQISSPHSLGEPPKLH